MKDPVIHSALVFGIIEQDIQSELDEAEAIRCVDPSEKADGYVDGLNEALKITRKQIATSERMLDKDGIKELKRLRGEFL